MNVGYGNNEMNIKQYRKNKIRMLKGEFKFPLTKEECDKISHMENEFEIERYCRTLYKKYLN